MFLRRIYSVLTVSISLLAFGLPANADSDLARQLLGLGLKLILEAERSGSTTQSAPSSSSSGTAVVQRTTPAHLLQADLTIVGFDVGPIDGLIGRKTSDAIRSWQRNIGVNANGELTEAQRIRLRAQALRVNGEQARADALEVQTYLNAQGFDAGPADGVWGSRTNAALTLWRRDNDVTAQGRPAQDEIDALFQIADSGAGQAVTGTAPPRPSFNCDNASIPTEFAICGSQELAALDVRLNDKWNEALEVFGRDELLSDQQAWAKQRNECQRDESCLAQSISSRIGVLDAMVRRQANQELVAQVGQGVLQPFTRDERLRQTGGGYTSFGCANAPIGGEVDLATCATFDRYQGVDVPGYDLRSALEDPLLQDLDLRQCEAICFATEGCGAYTLNEAAGGYCFLKSYDGSASRFNGAVSGVLRGVPTKRPNLPYQLAIGTAPHDPTMTPFDGETAAAFQDRVTSAAAQWGGACAAEEAQMRSVADELRFSMVAATAVTGRPTIFEWDAPKPASALPLWIGISTTQNVRIGGDGLTLGPETPGPFKIAHAAGATRSMAMIRPGDDNFSGRFEVVPLQADELELNLHMVGWLRACEREVVLHQEQITLTVDPAPAEVVLTTAAGIADFTHAVDIPEWDRIVEYNHERLRILSSDGAEIGNIAGSDLMVSPTKRFLVIEQSFNLSVVDVIDGYVHRAGPAEIAYWGKGDSAFIVTSSPWGRVDVVAPFSGLTLLEDVNTGPSCCPAVPSALATEDASALGVATHLAMDLNNWTLSVQGGLSDGIRSLQTSEILGGSPHFGGYSSSGQVSTAMTSLLRQGLSPVAPYAVANDFDITGGYDTWVLSQMPKDVVGRLQSVGMTVRELDRVTPTILLASDEEQFRGADPRIDETIASQFSRVGVTIQAGQLDQDLITIGTNDPDFSALYGHERMAAFLEKNAAVFDEVQAAADNAGWDFAWRDAEVEEFSPNTRECYHVDPDEELVTDKSLPRAYAPVDIDQLARHDTPDGPIYLGRAFCVAGATLGSLRHYSAFVIMDFTQDDGTTDQVFVENRWTFESRYDGYFWDQPFRSRLYGRLLLIYTPQNGSIALRDLDTNEAIWVGEDLPNGDLMSTAWLTEDRGHVVQLNTDGSFFVHRARDGALVLSGRIVDDEVAIWSADYRFDATAEAAARIDLRFPGTQQQFSLDRFDASLRTPNLAPRVIGGELAEDVTRIAIPPIISGQVTSIDGMITSEIQLEDPDTAHEVRIFQDGVQTHILPLDGRQSRVSVEAPRIASARHVSVLVADATGLVSLPISADLGPQAGSAAPKLRGMVVGIDRYDDPELIDLNYAKADADRMRRVLTESATEPFELTALLADSRAQPDSILESAEALIDGLSAGDHGVIFIAGHGLEGEDGDFYLATTQTDMDNVASTSLSWSRLSDVLAKTDARITILIDACHSGTAGFASNDQAASNLVETPANVTILAASKGRQLSAESSNLGGGLFTLALEQVIDTQRGVFDLDKNGRIEADELEVGVRDLVHQASDGRQTPWMTNRRMVGRYALF